MEIIQLLNSGTRVVGRQVLMLLLFYRFWSVSIKKKKLHQILKLVYLEIMNMKEISIRKITERVDSN